REHEKPWLRLFPAKLGIEFDGLPFGQPLFHWNCWYLHKMVWIWWRECAPEIPPRQCLGKLKFSKLKAEIDNSCILRINQFDTSPSIFPHDPRNIQHSTFNAEQPRPDGHRASLLGVECSMLNVSTCVQRRGRPSSAPPGFFGGGGGG